MSHSLRKPMSKFPTLIFRRFMNTCTETYQWILHSLASSSSLLHIYIIRRFMNTSMENYKCILHSLASLFLSPTHLYLQEVYEYENGELYRHPPSLYYIFISSGGLWILVRRTSDAYCILLHPPPLPYIFISLAGLGICSFAHRSFAQIVHLLICSDCSN